MNRRLLLIWALAHAPMIGAIQLPSNKADIYITGPIEWNVVKAAEKLIELSQNSDTIDILINSPGGQVIPGEMFVDAIELVKAQGVKVRCTTGVMAASMAFMIFSHCSERYAAPSALLMYHPARVAGMVSLRGKDALELGKQLQELDNDALDYLEDSMGMNRERLEETYYSEKTWKASKLAKETRRGWINILNAPRPDLYKVN